MNKKLIKELYNIENQLIHELAKNGTDKSRELFIRWQRKRIELKENTINEITKLLNNFKDAGS